MTFQELSTAKWFHFKPTSIDVLILLTTEDLRKLIARFDHSYAEDNSIWEEQDKYLLLEVLKKISDKQHLFWEFKLFGGGIFLDTFASNIDIFDADSDYEVIELNLEDFKRPTIIIQEI